MYANRTQNYRKTAKPKTISPQNFISRHDFQSRLPESDGQATANIVYGHKFKRTPTFPDNASRNSMVQPVDRIVHVGEPYRPLI